MTGSPTARVLAAYLVVLVVQRVIELAISRRNWNRLRARGAREVGAGHFPVFVLLHVLYPVALVVEVLRGARPGPGWPFWLAAWLVAQALRVAAITALGDRWNVRIVVVPGDHGHVHGEWLILDQCTHHLPPPLQHSGGHFGVHAAIGCGGFGQPVSFIFARRRSTGL